MELTEGWRIAVKREGDTVGSVREQIARPLILDTLGHMRQAAPMADSEGLGRWALCIPHEDWLRLRDKYPALASPDQAEKSRAYVAFINSSESAPFRVRERI